MLLARKASGTIIRIHRDCQKSVYNEMKRKSSEPIACKTKIKKVARRRSEVPKFAWKKQCMFCEKECFYDRNHPDRIDWRHVQVLSIRETLLSICSSRNDQMAEHLKRSLLDCIDLVAAEARPSILVPLVIYQVVHHFAKTNLAPFTFLFRKCHMVSISFLQLCFQPFLTVHTMFRASYFHHAIVDISQGVDFSFGFQQGANCIEMNHPVLACWSSRCRACWHVCLELTSTMKE